MSDVLLEEYKTLREELLLHVKLERQILALSGTLAFLVLTFMTRIGAVHNYDLWGVTLVVLLTPVFIIYRMEVFAVAKIASYIELCIESRIPDLCWTTRHIRSHPTFGSQLWSCGVVKLDSLTAIGIYFLVLLALSWAIPIWLKGTMPSLPALLVMIPFSTVYIINFITLKQYKSYRDEWSNIWSEAGDATPCD